MAIAHARLQFIQRSQGKNACCKAAYNSRGTIKFEGHDFNPPKTYNWSYKEPCVFHDILLPTNVNLAYKNSEFLWNAAEMAEVKKNSQIAMELVLALPDDNCISIEDRVELTKNFVQKNFVDKGLAVQIDIHSPENKTHLSPESGEVKSFDHNWHAHILITTRYFSLDGNSLAEKARNIMPDVKTTKNASSKLYVDGEHWGKSWGNYQNRFFEEKGLSLRVDPIGINSQIHLGPIRMRGRAYDLLDENNLRAELNKEQAKNPTDILNHITKHKNIFTNEDVTALLEKFIEEKHQSAVINSFWQQKEIVSLVDFENQPTGQFTTKEILAEERRCLDFANSINQEKSLKLKSNFGQFISNLSEEQKVAYRNIISGKRLSCIGGYAGTGKSHLLVALKKTYEAEGYTVRGFGPDTATSKVLEEKGFSFSENLYRFLFHLNNQKREIKSGKEIWIIDEASKIGNRPMVQLLKVASENNVQLVFSGDQSQLGAVDRGCMYKVFCEKYGSEDLLEIKRQQKDSDRQISKQIATGKISHAIDQITRTGNIIWNETRKDCIEQLIIKWARDKIAFPDDSSVIIAHSQAERKVLNEMVRLYRKERGEISTEEFECKTGDKKVYVSVGDQIEFSKNDKVLAVTNGMLGTLIEASPNKFIVSVKEKDANRLVTFDPTTYSSYQLGYATTYHRSQGKTVDRAYVLHSPRLNKESFYVGLTRHVQKAYLFVPKDNMHYLSYLKAKACGFNKNYQTYVRQQNQFCHQTQEDYTSQLKEQASQGEKKESTQSYQTLQESHISDLKSSNSIFKKLKGYSLSAWHQITGQVKEKNYAKKADYEFYHPDIKKEQQAKVIQLTTESIKEVSSDIQVDQKKIKNIIAQEKTINSSSLSLVEAFKKANTWKNLSSTQQDALQNYFQAKENAYSFYAVIKAEHESHDANDFKSSPHFNAWMQACSKRNEKAYDVTRTIPKKELENILGNTGLDILWEKSHKHEIELNKAINKNLNIDTFLKENLESLLFKLFPDGPSRRERDSLRFGSNGSLVVKCAGEKKGCFFDHKNEIGGGPLHLIQQTLSLSKGESIQWAKDFLNHVPTLSMPLKSFKPIEKVEQWISIQPDSTISAPSLKEINKGLDLRYQEVSRHAYHNEKAEILFYILRLADRENPAKKSILPLSYGKEIGEEKNRWSLKGYQMPDKPLYNLPELLKNPQNTILIVEGEKTADAAIKLFADEKITCVTWCGGASAVSKSDWSYLFGRQVVIWPDNDEAGFKAAEKICSELRKIGVKSLHMVNKEILEKQFPEKWDLADELPKGKNLSQIQDLILSAKEKSTGIDQLDLLTKKENTNETLQKLRLNEILWRVEERLRPSLEEKFSNQPWQINNEIQKEILKIIGQEEKIHTLITQHGIEGEIGKKIAYQCMIYQAEKGENLSGSAMQNLRKSLSEPIFQQLSLQVSHSLEIKESFKKELNEFLADKVLSKIMTCGAEKVIPEQEVNKQIIYATQVLEKENSIQEAIKTLDF